MSTTFGLYTLLTCWLEGGKGGVMAAFKQAGKNSPETVTLQQCWCSLSMLWYTLVYGTVCSRIPVHYGSFHCLRVTSIPSCLGFCSLSQTLWDKPLFSIFNNLAKQTAACLPAFPATCGNLFLLCRTFLLGYIFVAGAILLLLHGFWWGNFQVHIHMSKVFW